MTHYHGTTECNCDTWRRAELVGIVLAAVAAYVVLPPWLLVVAAAGYWIHLLRSKRAAGPSPGEILAALAPTERKVTASASSPTSPTSPVALPPAITPLTEPVGEDEYRITPFIFTSEPEEHGHEHDHEHAAAPADTRRDTPRDIKAALLAPAITLTSDDDDSSTTLVTPMNAAALSDAKAVDAKIDKILGGERGPNISHGRRRRKIKAPPAYSATANKLETVLEADPGADDDDDDCVSDTELDYAQPPPYAPSPILGPSLAPPTAPHHHRSRSAGEADFDAAAKAALRLDVEREIERIERQRQLERERARELEREQRNVDPLVAAELLAEIQRARELHAASVHASTSTPSPKLRPRSDSSSSTATRRLPRTPLARLSLPDDSDTSSVFSFDLDGPYDSQVDADIDELLLSPASMVSSLEGESSSAAARAILRAKSARSRIASIRRKRTDSGETADSEASSPMTPQGAKGRGSGPGTPVDRKGKGRAIPSLPPMSYAFGSPVVLPATPRWREGRSE